jgi:RHS repeat-associated protein
MPGDKITAEVYAKYVDPVSGNRSGSLNTFLTQVASLISSGTTSSGTVVDGGDFSNSTTSFPFPTQAASNTTGSSGAGPKAYLNWLVFDRDYNWISSKSGYKRISAVPKETGQDVAHELLNSPEITIDVAGYVYIFLSNEEATPIDVYFDDFKVTQAKSPVVQMDDYYPFGLAFNSFSRENSLKQDFKYNGKELQDELNLGWLDYGARMYMADVGRWGTLDPLSEIYHRWSPFVYGINNPIHFIDPDGMSVENFSGQEAQAWWAGHLASRTSTRDDANRDNTNENLEVSTDPKKQAPPEKSNLAGDKEHPNPLKQPVMALGWLVCKAADQLINFFNENPEMDLMPGPQTIAYTGPRVVMKLTTAAATKGHHYWTRFFRVAKFSLDDVTEVVKKVVDDVDTKWIETGDDIFNAGTKDIVGKKIITEGTVDGHTIWVTGIKRVDGEIWVTNAGVK